MPGVNIVIVETTMGTVSDKDGNFTLQADREKVKVAFSFVGFETQIKDLKNGDKTEVRLKKAVTIMNLDVPKKQTAGKSAQTDYTTERNTTGEVFFVVEDMPHFPGGMEALNKYVSSHIKYPGKAVKNKKEGKVYVNFTIDKAGNVQNVYVGKGKSIDPDLDKEAIRVISGMPNWKPGVQRGKAVTVDLSIPVEFRL
jgi:TonB family protein